MTRIIWRRVAVCVLVLGAVFAQGILTAQPAAAAAPASVDQAPAALDLTAHRGEVVVVDFWASWCRPCQASLPWLASLQSNYADRGLTILAVNVDRERERADRFLAGLPDSLAVVYDPAGKIASAYELEGMPMTFVYDRRGKLRDTRLGFDPRETTQLETELVALLKEEGGHGQ
jgi:thiol-disulfide isomerase/thioredoxin